MFCWWRLYCRRQCAFFEPLRALLGVHLRSALTWSNFGNDPAGPLTNWTRRKTALSRAMTLTRFSCFLSLTNPWEQVFWSLPAEYIAVGLCFRTCVRQMGKFRTLKSNKCGKTDKVLAGNFRPVQPLNGRIVYVQHEF